jgi:hypothetical protein
MDKLGTSHCGSPVLQYQKVRVATSGKVAGSRPDEVNAFFQLT